MSLPLANIRVVDASQIVAGPFVGQLLGDFGAEVIKIEHPNGGDPYRGYGPNRDGVPLGWKALSRNKKSITLNLSTRAGRELYMRLVEKADVVIESFRPSTLDRNGMTYDDLSRVNPAVIAVLVSAFGQTGPYRDRPGFGTLVEAMSGYADLTGEADGPPTLPQFALADSVAALYGAFGVMVALYWRDHLGGGGQCIDLSLLEPLFSILGPLAVFHDQLGLVMRRSGSRIYANAPRNVYPTADERWIAVAASTETIAHRLFEAIDRPDLTSDPRYATAAARVANVDAVDDIMRDWTGRHTLDDAMDILLRNEVAAAPVMNIADLVRDPHVLAREMLVSVDDAELGRIVLTNVLPRMSATPGEIREAGPSLGADNKEVYQDFLKIGDTELAQLVKDGVI